MLARKKLSRFFQGWARPFCLAVLLFFVCTRILPAQESSRKVTVKTVPRYPELAKKMHLAGKVKVEVVVNAAGLVTSAKIVGGNPVFETSAIEAVKQWKFEPASTVTKGVIVLDFASE
jgi:TonB family protein